MDEGLDLKADNVKLRDAITKALEKADPTTRKKDEEIAKSQPTHDVGERDVNDNLKRRKQALIDAGVWSDAPPL